MFTNNDLATMRATQEVYMQDTCRILVYAAGTADDYGEHSAPTYTPGSSIRCGLDQRPGFERHGAELTSIEYDGTLRLPVGTTLKETDRIRVTKRFGEDTTDIDYEISSPVQRGPSGLRVLVKKVVV